VARVRLRRGWCGGGGGGGGGRRFGLGEDAIIIIKIIMHYHVVIVVRTDHNIIINYTLRSVKWGKSRYYVAICRK